MCQWQRININSNAKMAKEESNARNMAKIIMENGDNAVICRKPRRKNSKSNICLGAKKSAAKKGGNRRKLEISEKMAKAVNVAKKRNESNREAISNERKRFNESCVKISMKI